MTAQKSNILNGFGKNPLKCQYLPDIRNTDSLALRGRLPLGLLPGNQQEEVHLQHTQHDRPFHYSPRLRLIHPGLRISGLLGLKSLGQQSQGSLQIRQDPQSNQGLQDPQTLQALRGTMKPL